ncbi:TFIIB-type zinc ribbon-containing protein [Vogesella alkaliphila]|uniref:Transcription factor zinc-finger domain-containing protein n=1 Tax=Vogesella alkaliphila TaxID=1193621 RepID=A0ABQ2YXD1_9NEIS|nr:zf-TFIIB domain-containing protein [Vogesella alkaliphila]GGX98487.1 hypothetical protein GCM10011290_28040 [Vogesella alkaliphila]
MQCPVCKDTTLVMSERQGIEIDYCPQCRGVWLDRGELDKIIQHSLGHMAAADAAPQAAQPGYPPRQPPQQQPYPQQPYPQQPYPQQQQPYSQHDKYGDNRHYKRKKSFWEDLFD